MNVFDMAVDIVEAAVDVWEVVRGWFSEPDIERTAWDLKVRTSGFCWCRVLAGIRRWV